MSFRAVMLSEKDRQVASSIVDLEDADLPQGDVLVSVDYSTLNYKDGMVLSGIGRLVRNYPLALGTNFLALSRPRMTLALNLEIVSF